MFIPKSCVVLLLSFLFSVSLLAQDNSFFNQSSFFRVTSAYSPQSIILLGKTPDSQTLAIQLSYGQKSKWAVESFPLIYLVSVTPFIKYHYPKRDEGSKRDMVRGLGISPVGFELQKKLHTNIGFVLNTAAGFVLIDKKFPTDKGRRLNYTFALSPGLIFKSNQSLSFLLGYKFHHISNAQTGSENPGIDSNFIFISTQIAI